MKNIIMYDKKNKKLIYVYFDGDKPKFWQNKKLIDDSLDIIVSVMNSFTLATVLTFSLKLGIFFGVFLSLKKGLPGEILKDFYSDITIPKIESLINDSKNLNDEEKEFLCNDDFLDDIIGYIQGTHMDFTTLYRLNNLEIVSTDNIDINGNYATLGHYSYDNKLYIYDYDEEKLNEYFLDLVPYKGLVGHEFSHLLMANFDYLFLNEGLASIITDEYFAPINNSYTEIKIRTKVLIEIIGKEPIMECVYGNNASSLIENIKKYLDNENEVTNFLDILKYKNEDGNFNYSEIDPYLIQMYFNKYGKELTNNEYMFCLYSNLYCNKGYLNDRLNVNGNYFLRNTYDNFYIYYRADASNRNLEPCFYINFLEEVPDLPEPIESYNNPDYVMVINYYPNSLSKNVTIDTLNNTVKYFEGGKEISLSLESAKEKGIIYCSYCYYKKSYENNLHTLIPIDINNASIYTFDNGIKKTINQVLLQKAQDDLFDINSHQEISLQKEELDKKLTLTNSQVMD